MAMWITEENAIRILVSITWQQIKEIQVIPTKETLTTNVLINHEFIRFSYKINPHPPNFNKMAARNIEPTTGASTWALGSHIWSPAMGNFVKNAT